jgi:FkbM family methyltransferase
MHVHVKDHLKQFGRPWALHGFRAYLRYFPVARGKLAVWNSLARFFENASRPFTAQTVFGAKMGGNTADFIAQHVFYFGIWEPCLTALISDCLHPGDVFVDVGANIGYFTLLASTLVGDTGSVIALEPSPGIHEQLLKNISMNGATNVRPLKVAAAATTGTVDLYLGDKTNQGETSQVRDGTERFVCSAPAKPLAEILRADEISRIGAIKIDVEGAEWHVVQGMLAMLAGLRDDAVIALEYSPDRMRALGDDPYRLFDAFVDAGFQPHRLFNDYKVGAYLPRPLVMDLVGLDRPPEEQTDIVFCRKPYTRSLKTARVAGRGPLA